MGEQLSLFTVLVSKAVGSVLLYDIKVPLSALKVHEKELVDGGTAAMTTSAWASMFA